MIPARVLFYNIVNNNATTNIIAPITGSNVPMIANTIATKFNVMENVILSLIVIIIRFDKAIRCGSSFLYPYGYTRIIPIGVWAVKIVISH